MNNNEVVKILLDTSFLINISKNEDERHCKMLKLLKEKHKNKTIHIYIPSIVIAEFNLKGDYNSEAEYSSYIELSFDGDHARNISTFIPQHGKQKDCLKDDYKIIAQALSEKIDYIITSDNDFEQILKQINTKEEHDLKVINTNKKYTDYFSGVAEDFVTEGIECK